MRKDQVKTIRLVDEKGFSIVSMLVAIAIMSMATLALVSASSTQSNSLKQAQRSADRFELANFVVKAFADASTCSCHLDGSVNTAIAKKLKINTNSKNIKDIDLGELRSTCDFSSSENILVTAGNKLPGNLGNLYVESVMLQNIRKVDAPKRFYGELAIHFTQGSDGSQVSPIIHGFGFEIDPTSGNPAQRPTSNCFKQEEPKVIDKCPPGFELIGSPGRYSNFCIEINERSPKTHAQATADCESLNPPYDLVSEVCWQEDLSLGCAAGVLMTGKTDNWEMTYNKPLYPGELFVALGNGCASRGLKVGNTATYRCCLF